MSDYQRRMASFARLTRPAPDKVDRLTDRLLDPEPRRRSAAPLIAFGALAAVLIATWTIREPAAAPIAIDLSARTGVVDAAEGVRLEAAGTGRVDGSTRDVLVTWEVGTLGVEVEPHAGIALQVQTPEGAARVVGTGFDVLRDAFGTTVTVRHGRVEVTCAEQPPVLLGHGESRSCLPVTAAGLLGRARALQEAGHAPEDVLSTLELGLGRDPAPQIRDELHVARIDVLVRARRFDQALGEARAYLASSATLRRGDIERLARDLEAVR